MLPDFQAYILVMEEIKLRIEVIRSLLDRRATVVYEATHAESMVLQIRMVTELIAFASLAANKQLFDQHRRKFERHWNLTEIIKDVEARNPDFYPRPVVEAPSVHEMVSRDLIDVTSGYLSKRELMELHGRCGDVLHAKNPFGKKTDYKATLQMIPTWIEQIRVLLNVHQIRLIDNEFFYLVQMHGEEDGNVHMYMFQRA